MPDDVFLLDTDIVSLFGRAKAPPGLRPWLLEVGVHRLAVSYPTITELMRGAHLRRRDDPEKAARIMAWIKRILSTRFLAPDMTSEVAEIYAHMTSEPSLRNMWTVQSTQKSNRLGHDLMIAAVAITHRLPILTANVSDFLRIHDRFPLPGIYQPLEGLWRLAPGREMAMPPLDRAVTDCNSADLPRIGDECGPAPDLRGPFSLPPRRRRYVASSGGNIFASASLRIRAAGQIATVSPRQPSAIFEADQHEIIQGPALDASAQDSREMTNDRY